MRILSFLLLVASFQVAAETSAQKISVKSNSLSIQQIIKVIESQTDYVVFCNKSDLKAFKDVTVDAKELPLLDFMQLVLDNQLLQFHTEGKTIVLSTKPTLPTASIIVVAEAFSGIIVNKETQEPISAASIMIKGSRKGQTANDKGSFDLTSLKGTETIVISATGFQSVEIKLQAALRLNPGESINLTDDGGTISKTGNNSFKVELIPQASVMENVVVNGIFKRPTANFTGSATQMTGKELRALSPNSLLGAISILEPSFKVLKDNVLGGNINELPNIQLRGVNSIPNLQGEFDRNANQPLFILDGFETTLQRVFDLDQNRVKDVTILKDASATAIYGSKAANGVVIINTIPPAAGALRLTINQNTGFSIADLSAYNLMNPTEKLEFEKRSGVYDGASPAANYRNELMYNKRLQKVIQGQVTDWLAQPIQNGINSATSMRIEGGDGKILYALFGNANLMNGVMKGQDRNNYQGGADLVYTLNNLKFRNSIEIFHNKSNESPYGSFSKYAQMNPYWSPYDSSGKMTPFVEDDAFGRFENPLYDVTMHTVHQSTYSGYLNNFQIIWDPFQFLNLESRVQLGKQNGQTDVFLPAQHSTFKNVSDPAKKGSYTLNSDAYNYLQFTTTVNYRKVLGRNSIYGTGSFDLKSSNRNNYFIETEGYGFDRLDNLLFATQYKEGTKPTGNELLERSIGMLLAGNYAYDNRFLLDISLKREGSSTYGINKKMATFWSVGTGWNLHNEAFLQQSDFINRFKIRGSYGSRGSANIPPYKAQTRYNFNVDNIYNGKIGNAIMAMGNNNLGWQDIRSFNIGADIELFQNRLMLSGDYFRDKTNNAITEITLAPSTGFSNYTENLGELQNTGFEVKGSYRIIQNKHASTSWTINASAAHYKNILKKLSNKLTSMNNAANTKNTDQKKPNTLLQEGQSIDAIFVVRSLGINPIDGNEIYLTRDGVPTYVWRAEDKVAAGLSSPKINGTFGSTFIHKGLTVNMQFQYWLDQTVYNSTLIDKVQDVDPRNNADKRAFVQGWSQPGDISQYARITNASRSTKVTSRFIQNENLLTLSSASIGYDFIHSNWIKKTAFNSIGASITMNDIFTASTIQQERGTANPFAKTVTLTLRASF